ncbi:MAG: hypothetical protein D3924_05420 [Candidatus Electrothrix sp. AR4]|nr:hypothetical protein [Candidatus Electrothrix sp. AR4]
MKACRKFALGVILLAVFSLYLGWFPAAGAGPPYTEISFQWWLLDLGHHLTLPLDSLVIAYFPGNFGFWARCDQVAESCAFLLPKSRRMDARRVACHDICQGRTESAFVTPK